MSVVFLAPLTPPKGGKGKASGFFASGGLKKQTPHSPAAHSPLNRGAARRFVREREARQVFLPRRP